MYVVQINEFLILLILIEQIFETKLVSLPGEMNRSADFGRQSEKITIFPRDADCLVGKGNIIIKTF